jgi:hypothetical protein
MSYWNIVARRAAREAARDVKIETRIAVVILLITQAVIGGGLFLALGQLTGANLWTRIMTGLAPFLLYPLAFLARLVIVPIELDAHRQSSIAELEAEREERYWAALGGDKAKRGALLGQLRELYKLGADGISPELAANLAWPSKEWLNAALERRGMPWRVERIEEDKVYTQDFVG